MKRIVIVEDDILLAEEIKSELDGLGYCIDGIASGEEELNEILEVSGYPEAVVMDIELKGNKDGVELAHDLNKVLPVGVVYLTDKDDDRTMNRIERNYKSIFASKPITNFTSLGINLDIAIQEKENREKEIEKPDFVFVIEKDRNDRVKVDFKELEFVEANGSSCDLNTVKKKKHTISKNLTEFLPSLSDDFIRVHRSHIVNITCVESIENWELVMQSKKVITVSKSYQAAVKKALNLV